MLMPTVPRLTTVHTRTVATDSGPLQVATVVPARTAPRTFVLAMGYAASLEAFELQRFKLLAEELAARIVVVETPGYGSTRSHLTARERLALLRGDFLPVAARMLQAAGRAVPDLHTSDAQPLTGVIGYSLGTSIGTAMARHLHDRNGTPVQALVLVEPVAAQRWSPRALLHATGVEDGRVDRALADNAAVPGSVEPWDRREGAERPYRHQVDLGVLANALRFGRLPQEVSSAHPGRVLVVHGTASELSLPTACNHLTAHLRAEGLQVNELEVTGGHALWHSLPTVRRLARWVTTALAGEAP